MSARLKLAERVACDDVNADAMRAQARALLPYLLELLDQEHVGGELVDVAKHVPLPRRLLYRACREGRIEGVSKVGRRYLASRAAVEAWLRAHGPRLVRPSADEDVDELESLRARLARPEPARRRRKVAS